MKRKFAQRITTFATASALAISCLPMNVFAYGEVDVKTSTFSKDTDNSSEFQTWRDTVWSSAKANSGQIALTPGENEDDLNLAWYSVNKGTPAVKVWEDGHQSSAKVVTGTATDIAQENWQGSTYAASNKVTISDYFKGNTKYHYQYTDNYVENGTTTWSETYDYKAADASSFSVILTGDPQIGASGSSDDKTASDSSAARDAYNWDITMKQAMETDPDAAFLLSAGDQINNSNATKAEDRKTRESEYAGYLYSSVFRSLPIASTIGNHDLAGDDYTLHFNNPNSEENLGATAAGGDYYFSYGDVLFISLNSNNRNQEEHRKLMTEATKSNPDAKWKVVIFHSDIYGSGEPHADTDASANRIVFAPLMDEFNIDVCLTGHDHTYSRSYQVLDGNVIDYDIEDGSVEDPEGTLYITTGSGSGSKYYNLLNYTPYYIAERTNECLPAFSTIDFTDSSLTIKTYDYTGEKYADDFTINKSGAMSVDETIENAESKLAGIDTTKYTQDSITALRTAIDNLKAVRAAYTTAEDAAETKVSTMYGKTAEDGTSLDPVKSYGSVTNDEDKDITGTDEAGENVYANRFKEGYSTLLDKTIYLQLNGNDTPLVDSAKLAAAKADVVTAVSELKEIETEKETETTTEAVTDKTTEGTTASVEEKTTNKVQAAQETTTSKATVKTGDNSSAVIPGLFAAAMASIGAVLLTLRKKEEDCETK